MEIIPADRYDALTLAETQKTFVMTPEGMRRALMRDDTFGFYAVENGVRYGFALLRRLGSAEYFLWEYVIDHSYQGQGRGRAFLSALIALLRETYGANTLWTTYIWGNDAARRLYESLGFVETDVVDEDGIHEVNLCLRLS